MEKNNVFTSESNQDSTLKPKTEGGKKSITPKKTNTVKDSPLKNTPGAASAPSPLKPNTFKPNPKKQAIHKMNTTSIPKNPTPRAKSNPTVKPSTTTFKTNEGSQNYTGLKPNTIKINANNSNTKPLKPNLTKINPNKRTTNTTNTSIPKAPHAKSTSKTAEAVKSVGSKPTAKIESNKNHVSKNMAGKTAGKLTAKPATNPKNRLSTPFFGNSEDTNVNKSAKAMGHKNKSGNKLNSNEPRLRAISLGGLYEIGKNMMVLEYGNDMIIIDCGVAFPEENMPGVDAVIQDHSYIFQNRHKVRGIFLTHGHEDHIGALPYLMKELKCPIYGGRLTIELVRRKLTDKGTGTRGIELVDCLADDVIKAGNSFFVEFIRVNHSIADAFSLAIRTPVGTVIHTGDFKIDYTPINGLPIDLQKFAKYGQEGVLLLMCESTNVEIPGSSSSEHQVGESFEKIFQKAPGRIIVATFSSHVHRMQQIFTAAEKFDRKVTLVGRSMVNVFGAANSLNYINMKPDTLIDINQINNYPPDKVVILTTGSQAEPMSALSRMAFASHRLVEIHQEDTVILSAHPIPGNEKPIYRVINELFKLGATVIYEDLADVHVSGHAHKDEIMLIHQLVQPKYFIPVHGEYRMLVRHGELAHKLGQSWDNIFVLNNGDIFECNQHQALTTGFIQASPVLIDGSGFGDIDNKVLRDRKLLADDGVVTITLVIDEKNNMLLAAPKVYSIGFLFDSEAKEILSQCGHKIKAYLIKSQTGPKSIETIAESGQLREFIKNFLYEQTKRRPLIMIACVPL